MKKMIAAVILLMATLLGVAQTGLGIIQVQVVIQENPFVALAEREIFANQLGDGRLKEFKFSPDEIHAIVEFLNYSISGPATPESQAWARNPLWRTGSISEVKALLVERALKAKPTFWSGNISYTLTGPANFTVESAPKTFRDIPLGSYTLNYSSSGPQDVSFAGTTRTTPIQSGGIFNFNIHFKAPTLPEWRKVIEKQPQLPTYAECPERTSALVDSIVVVTHGWQPVWKPVDIAWVESMTNSIKNYLISRGLKNWKVHAHRWVKGSRTKNPDNALAHGKEEGVTLGECLANQGWEDIHLIGHSSGAGLIQAAAERIKTLNPYLRIHLTFLDPFVGFDDNERDNYGNGAEWSDSYYTRDLDTGGGTYPFTEGQLRHAYNVDVTGLDPNRERIEIQYSTQSGEVSQTCYQIVSSHGWPIQFYANTIPPSTMIGSQGFGFPLSKEGGNWTAATNQFKVGINSLRVLGSSDLVCSEGSYGNLIQLELPIDFSRLPNTSVILNSPQNVIIRGIDFELRTASPAWLAAIIPITNKVNLVSFETWFTSTNGANGLLSVYWETNLVDSIRERHSSRGLNQYRFVLPEAVNSGTKVLGFRLDAFGAIQSSATITNVALGFAGMNESFYLSITKSKSNGLPVLELIGPPGYPYSLESSTNLNNWKGVGKLVNTNGTVRFAQTNSTSTANMFYRALVP